MMTLTELRMRLDQIAAEEPHLGLRPVRMRVGTLQEREIVFVVKSGGVWLRDAEAQAIAEKHEKKDAPPGGIQPA